MVSSFYQKQNKKEILKIANRIQVKFITKKKNKK
jgi:hypothetical protein